MAEGERCDELVEEEARKVLRQAPSLADERPEGPAGPAPAHNEGRSELHAVCLRRARAHEGGRADASFCLKGGAREVLRFKHNKW